MYKTRKSFRPFRPSFARCLDGDEVVQNNLAVTPSSMVEMMNNGISISSQNMAFQASFDAHDIDMSVPLEFERGTCLGDLYQAQQDVRSKFKKHLKDNPQLLNPQTE